LVFHGNYRTSGPYGYCHTVATNTYQRYQHRRRLNHQP
jgi:hypothetical protein